MSTNPYNYIIYKSGSTYYARRNDGTQIASTTIDIYLTHQMRALLT